MNEYNVHWTWLIYCYFVFVCGNLVMIQVIGLLKDLTVAAMPNLYFYVCITVFV